MEDSVGLATREPVRGDNVGDELALVSANALSKIRVRR